LVAPDEKKLLGATAEVAPEKSGKSGPKRKPVNAIVISNIKLIFYRQQKNKVTNKKINM